MAHDLSVGATGQSIRRFAFANRNALIWLAYDGASVRPLEAHDDSIVMSHSRKKTPKGGITCARSEKQEKVANHRRERRRVHQLLADDPEVDLLPHTRELSDPWSMAKDGKAFLGRHASRKTLRK